MSFFINVMQEITRLGNEQSIPHIIDRSQEYYCCHDEIIKFATSKEMSYFLLNTTILEDYTCSECTKLGNIVISIMLHEIMDSNHLSSEFIESLKKTVTEFQKKVNDAPWKECNGDDLEFFYNTISFDKYEDVFSCDFEESTNKIRALLETIATISNIDVVINKGFKTLGFDYCKNRIYVCGKKINRIAFFEALNNDNLSISKIKKSEPILNLEWNS